MKTLENFKSEKVNLKSIFGGGTVTTGGEYEDKNGCCNTVTDSYEDTNGNGKQDGSESGSMCVETKC